MRRFELKESERGECIGAQKLGLLLLMESEAAPSGRGRSGTESEKADTDLRGVREGALVELDRFRVLASRLLGHPLEGWGTGEKRVAPRNNCRRELYPEKARIFLQETLRANTFDQEDGKYIYQTEAEMAL